MPAGGDHRPKNGKREEAEVLVRSARYRPEGERGISTFAGHNNFTRIPDVPAFLAQRNREIMLIAQIETQAGVENCEAILSTPGLDACLIGTGDLAMGMGHAGQPDHPAVVAEAEKVLATAAEHGLLTTIPIRTPGEVRALGKAGDEDADAGDGWGVFGGGGGDVFEGGEGGYPLRSRSRTPL